MWNFSIAKFLCERPGDDLAAGEFDRADAERQLLARKNSVER
jgi:hypothetical protein